MGSRKKLVLASLVSLMMVLAFLIGLVPSHTTLGADAASGSQGRPDFVNLLADVLGLKASGGDPAQAISVLEPRTASLVRIPEDSVAAYLQFKADVDPPLSDPGAVAYVIDGDFVGDDRWVGEYYSNLDNPPTQPPYTGWVDVASLAMATSDILDAVHYVYALGGAAEVLKLLTEAEIQYTIRSNGPGDDPAPFVACYILEESADVDADNNGLPDDLFGMVAPGETWLATYEVLIYDDQGNEVGFALRQVAVVNLDPGAAKQTELDGVSVAPIPTVSVTAPVLQDFQDAGLIDAGESGLLIVAVADDLSAMLDQVDGVNSGQAIGAWAAAANEYAPPGGLVPGTEIDDTGNYVEVSIVATIPDAPGFEEVEDLGDLAVDLELRDLDIPEETDVALWSLATLIAFDDPDFVITNDGEISESSWEFRMLRGEEQAPNAFIASLNRLSIFAAFESAMSIYELYPDVGAVGKETATDILGDFGDIMADMTLDDTRAAYAVYFDDVEATITGGLTLLDGKAEPEHAIRVLAPADFLTPQSVDVKVVDNEQPSNIALKAGGFTYLTEYELVIHTTGTGTGTVTPESGTLFLVGDVATLTATADADSEFVQWEELNGTPVIYTDNPLMIVMDQDREFNAVFDEVVVEEVTLELLVELAGGGVLEVVGTDPPGQTAPNFLLGTVVDLLATAAEGYDFDYWIGDVVETGTGTNSATCQVTMDEDKLVTAVFVLEPVVVTYTLTILPADGGTTLPADGAYDYDENTVVSISAIPNAGYEFVEWIGPVDLDTSLADNQVTMDADKTVQPVFQYGSPIIGESVTPNEAWLFGGIVAQIDGEGFKVGASVTIGDVPAQVIQVVPPNAIYVIVPALQDTGSGTEAEIDGPVQVTNPPGVLPHDRDTRSGIFTYKRYDIDGDVITTAFYVQDDDPIGLALDVDDNDEPDFPSAYVRLPAPDSTTAQTTTPYGLARATTEPAAVDAHLIDPNPSDGSGAIAGIWDFAVHLYENTYPMGSTFNTESLGIAVYNEIDEWSYDRTQASQTTPPLRASLLEFPVDATGLTAANLKNGLTLWSLETDYDYGTGTSTPALGTTAYQSTLLSGEARDAAATPITLDTADGTAIDTVVARVYDLSAFSLRAGAIELPDTITGAVMLDITVAGQEDGTAESDSTDGGTPVYITAPNGGFGWVRVAFGDFDAAKQDQPWDSFPGAAVTNNGQDEFYIECQSPAYPDPDIEEDAVVDIGIYLESDLSNPAVVLEDVFKYKAEIVGPPCPDICSILLILLGLAAALIGLAAGGDSGGGGGGPCFIATAAYGTPMAADIDTLRAVRDTYLLNSAVGTAFVDAYYHVSPAIADVVAKYPVAAATVRIVLVPVIWAAKLVMAMPAVSALLAFTAVALATLRRRRSKV